MVWEEEERSIDEEANEEEQKGRVSVGFSVIRGVSRVDGKGGIGEDRIVNVGEVNGGRSVEKGSNENEERMEEKGETEKG